MTRRFVATACTLLAIAWASSGVAWFPSAGPATPVMAGAVPTAHAAPTGIVSLVGVGTLCAMAAFGFRRPRRWPAEAVAANREAWR